MRALPGAGLTLSPPELRARRNRVWALLGARRNNELRSCAADTSSDGRCGLAVGFGGGARKACNGATGTRASARAKRREGQTGIAAGDQRAGRTGVLESPRYRLRWADRAIWLERRIDGFYGVPRFVAAAGQEPHGVHIQRPEHYRGIPARR